MAPGWLSGGCVHAGSSSPTAAVRSPLLGPAPPFPAWLGLPGHTEPEKHSECDSGQHQRTLVWGLNRKQDTPLGTVLLGGPRRGHRSPLSLGCQDWDAVGLVPRAGVDPRASNSGP